MPAIRLAGLSVIAIAGIAGLTCDAWPGWLPWPSPYMHAAFGALLLSMVLVSFRRETAAGSLIDSAAHTLRRRLSHDVYLLLYLVFGADLLIRAAAGGVVSAPPENLRDYFTYGLAALLTIRVLTVV